MPLEIRACGLFNIAAMPSGHGILLKNNIEAGFEKA
jgi:hypothetical protein